MKYKNKDGIELSYTRNDAHQVLVREVVSEAVKICSQYNWHDETSMRWTLELTKDYLIENFNLEDENAKR